jgi:hypothetical protein
MNGEGFTRRRYAAAILDRVLERRRFIHLGGPSGRTRHLNLEETLLPMTEPAVSCRILNMRFPAHVAHARVETGERAAKRP